MDLCGLSQEWARNVRAGKSSKGDKLGPADHSKMNYRPFRRNFYIEVPELQRMSEAEVAEYRKLLDGIKVQHPDTHGRNSLSPLRASVDPMVAMVAPLD